MLGNSDDGGSDGHLPRRRVECGKKMRWILLAFGLLAAQAHDANGSPPAIFGVQPSKVAEVYFVDVFGTNRARVAAGERPGVSGVAAIML